VGKGPAPPPNGGVPDALEFRTKWQIALEQITQLAVEGVPAAPVVADAGYGVVTAFRDALTLTALRTSWGSAPRRPCGRPAARRCPRRSTGVMVGHRRWSVARGSIAPQRAHLGPATAGERLAHRDVAPGHAGAMRSRFAAVGCGPRIVTTGSRRHGPKSGCSSSGARGSRADQVWLSTLPPTATRADVVRLAMLRWRIERDYQELKDELGLDHFEGRAGALSSSRLALHRRVCVPRRGAAGAFPPESLAFLRPARLPRVSRRGALPCVLNGTRRIPSRRCTDSSPGPWRGGGRCLECGHHPRTNLVTQ